MTHSYPEVFDFQGFNAPSRIECDIYDLIIAGRDSARDRRLVVSCDP